MGCNTQNTPSLPAPSEPTIRLSDLDITTGQTIYVPAYSEMYIMPERTLDLAVTLTIHNTDFENPIILTSVRYYDTQGQLLKEYLTEPRQLNPLASTDFFVEASEQSGGIGTNFVVEWGAEQPVFEPIVEAIMLNASNDRGISLTSPGRVIKQITPQENLDE
ncbi:MAG: DUF3124 domain-containing protein [Anaerolineae bacterium]|nr:DUF3124 domain-containing protein [Anaerolineae bacterium]